MGKRGPKPKSKTALDLSGSWRGKKVKESPLAPGAPVKPSYLKGLAKKKWLELVEQITKLKINLGEIDSTCLARYCELWEWYRKELDDIRENGETETCTNKNGDDYIAVRPQVGIALKLAGLLAKLESEFGLTPAARCGLKIEGKTPVDDELDALLNRRQLHAAGA
jgi:P27 family predicted phage terminase small subunit